MDEHTKIKVRNSTNSELVFDDIEAEYEATKILEGQMVQKACHRVMK